MKKTLFLSMLVVAASFLVISDAQGYILEYEYTGTDYTENKSNPPNYGINLNSASLSSSPLYSVAFYLSDAGDGSEAETIKVKCVSKNLLTTVYSTNQASIYSGVYPAWYVWTFASTSTLALNNIYYCVLSCIGTGCSTDDISWYNNHATTTDNGTTPYSLTYVPTFKLYSEEDLGDTINFSQTPTSTCDFWAWSVENTLSAETYAAALAGEVSAQVQYGTVSDPNLFLYQDNYGGIGSVGYPYDIPKANDLQLGIYYAQAYLCDSTNSDDCDFSLGQNGEHLIASSDIWEFIIADKNEVCQGMKVPRPGFTWPFATSTEAGDTFTCDKESSWFSRSWCYFLEFMLVPSDYSLRRWTNLKSVLEHKPPFGYISVYNSAMDGIATSTATSSIDFSWMDETTFFSRLKTILAWVLWLLFVIFMVKIFTKIKF